MRSIAEDRAVLADEERPPLAVAAQADAAFHVALHGHEDLLRLQAVAHEFLHREAHHDAGAADQGHGAGRIEPGPGDELGHHPDVAPPVGVGGVHGDVDPEVETAAPALQLPAVEQVLGGAGPVDQLDVAEFAPVLQKVIQGRPQGRQPQAPGDDQDVVARHSATGQGAPKGPRTPSTSPRFRRQMARVTLPTSRTVWTRVSGRAGSPLMEMGTSPTPKA